jgi:hypothetical protein
MVAEGRSNGRSKDKAVGWLLRGSEIVIAQHKSIEAKQAKSNTFQRPSLMLSTQILSI